jgi:hypothetical protein
MRALTLFFVALLGPGCVPVNSTSDYLEMHGSFHDGHPINQHLPATTGSVRSLTQALGTVTAVGALATGPDDLRGFRIEWLPGQVQAGTSYESSAAGPVAFYIIGPDADAGSGVSPENPNIAGGSITFSQVSSSKSVVKGSVANIILNAGDSPFITLDNGTFQASQP